MGEVNEGIKPDTTTDNYDTWSWKQIKVAVCGGFGMGPNKELDLRNGVSNPQTFYDAATYFYGAQTTLTGVQTGLEQLLKAVGDTWKGKGAEAFTKMLKRLKGSVDVLVDALTGIGVEQDYYSTLNSAGGSLTTAINEIETTDAWGANTAVQRFTDEHGFMDDGEMYYDAEPPWKIQDDGSWVVAVSTYPDIVDEMTRQMRASINKLAGDYRQNTGDLRDPGQPTIDTSANDPPDPTKIDIPPLKVDMPKIKPPKFGGGGKPPGIGGAGAPPKLTAPGGIKGGAPPKLTTPGEVKPPGGIDAPKLPANGLLAGGVPGTGGPGDLPPVSAPHLQALDDSQLPPLHHATLPDPAKFDPLTHLSGTNSPNLSPFAQGLRLPGAGDLHDPAGLAAGLRSPDSAGFRLSPGGTVLPASAFGTPGRFGPRSSGLAAEELAGGPGGRGLSGGAGGGAGGGVAGGVAGRGLSGGPGGAGAAGGGAMGGMPYMPMSPGGGRGRDDERERNTWLQEDEDVWGVEPQCGPAFLDGSAADD